MSGVTETQQLFRNVTVGSTVLAGDHNMLSSALVVLHPIAEEFFANVSFPSFEHGNCKMLGK